MPEHLARIHATLSGLARRERGNLLRMAAFAAIGGVCVGWALLTAAFAAEWVTPRFGPVWLGLVAVAGLGAAALPLRERARARDPRRQAARVEQVRPELRGQLLTVLDRTERPLGSLALVERMARRVEPLVAAVPAGEAHPERPVVQMRRVAIAGLSTLAMASLLQPGPIEALRALATFAVDAAAPEAPVDEGPRALVGDLTLRYLYPTYTRLPPMEVPNSNGDVRAPPGTRVEVRARTADPYESASLRVYDGEPEPIEILDGRELRAAFTVAGEGTWRFEFGDLPSPDYRIVPDADLPPDVVAMGGKLGDGASVDAPLGIPWAVKDDYGNRRVVVEVQEGKGEPRSYDLRTLLDVPREANGIAQLTPADLGLAPGDEAVLRIGAWDNDEISGSKVGWSAAIAISVEGAQGRVARQHRYWRALRDALVLVLADFVVEPTPPVASPVAARAWTVAADGRYADVDRLVEDHWKGLKAGTFDATALREVTSRRRELLAFARTLGERDDLGERDAATLTDLQAAHTVAVEQAILVLDQVVRARAQDEVARLVREVAEEAKALREEFADLDKQAALAKLDQLLRQLQRLARAASKLDEGSLAEFVNDRVEAMDSLVREIRKAIAEGRMDDAKALMDRLAEAMERMAEDMNAMQERQQSEASELDEAMKRLEEELEKLEADQRALREQTERARSEGGPEMEKAVAAWEEVERLAARTSASARGLSSSAEAFRDADYGNRSALEEAVAETEGLHDSARARDLGTAIERAERADAAVSYLARRLRLSRERGRLPEADVAPAEAEVARMRQDLARVRELLEQMLQRVASGDPGVQRKLQELAAQQEDLAQREADARDAAEQ
ncbi:MAG: DUF4175 family protein, partial [Myxococcota bacterium]